MNPFDYSLSELRKAIVSVIYLGGMVAALILTGYDPGFTEALIALVGPVFGVVGVFLAKNHSPDDLQKALEQVKAAALTCVGYFVVIPTSTETKLVILIGSVAAAYGVYYRTNAPPEMVPAS
jgi:hypothetical protein